MTTILFAAVLATATAAELPPWRNPAVNSINRLPARTLLIPAESMEIATGIADGSLPKTASRYVQSLNGVWDFKWKSNWDRDWEKEAKIMVPGCWQLQGNFDPPLYTNMNYPIAYNPEGDPLVEPPKHYTSYKMRCPVGLYTTKFKRPWRWWFRRTVLRFEGVSSAFYVRVNGKEVGYAEDSRLPSEFDLTDYLHIFGENTLEVEVYKHSDGSYLEDQDFWRFSGIFRDVSLISEHPKAPKDFIIDTELKDDFSYARFYLRDENGQEIKMREVNEPKLWSPDYPYVYMTPVEHKRGWWIFGGIDYYIASFGFRKVEIKDSVVYLNGKRVLFKGVNRHEMTPWGGYAITSEEMNRDIEILKEYNINAVRTCHYPDAPEWYRLTDRDGVMVVCEANVEAHGVPGYYGGKGKDYLPANPRFHDAIVERNTRMVKFYRHHPSIVIWSLGNESGDGPAMADAYKAIKAIDTTRPIQYEAAQDSDHSDIKCPMYMRPWECEKYVKSNPKKPMVLCEYTHAMGNSNGGVMDYWRLAKKYPSFQGGFVWDFVDQAVLKNVNGKMMLAYGGDFGDQPNDDNFNCNGLFDAFRNPHPGAFELKYAYQPIHVTDYDWATGKATIENASFDFALKEYECLVIKRNNGEVIGKNMIELPNTPAGKSCVVEVPADDADSVYFEFQHDCEPLAHNQFSKPFVPKPVKSGAAFAGHPFKFNFWRAPTDNDRGWRMSKVCEIWNRATATQKLPDGVKSELVVMCADEEGTYDVVWKLTVPKGLPPIPRVGLTFTVPKAQKVKWYGLGPWENYCDRAESAILGRYEQSVGLIDGLVGDMRRRPFVYPANILNPDNYIEPGEQGYRTGVRELKIGEVEIEALGAPFGFNVWPYPQTGLEERKHMCEVQCADRLTVNIDAAQMGVGGDNSWGARPHDDAMLGAGTYNLSFRIKGI